LQTVRVLIFDWGDTLMRDFPEYPGPMANWPKIEVIPGVTDLLAGIHTDYICCVASNAGDSDAELMGLALEKAGIREYFKYLFTSKELGYQKPEIGFFTEISARLAVPPDLCLMIGNDYRKDIIPAKDGGMKTALYMAKQVSEAFPKADIVVNSMIGLLQYL
jgi:FMN phosphatase YigB (HAD superfamily)